MAAISIPAARRIQVPGSRRTWVLALLAVTAVLYLLFRGTATLPFDDQAPLFQTLNDVRDWVDLNRTTNAILIAATQLGDLIGQLVGFIDGIFHGLAWPAVLAIVATLGLIAGSWRIAILQAAGFAALGILGLWNESLDTLALTIAAVMISLLIGIPLGILAGRSTTVERILTPILDVMQIMPTFAYLAPFALIFAIGAPTATIVTLIYAMPAAIRISSLGIRGVPAASVEAAVSIGATRWQVLRKVQLPQARRTIGLAINQTIMLALSMVVITALIGAPGLGQKIVNALEKLDVGAAFDAGLAIVIVAILLDRLTAQFGERMDPRFRAASAVSRPIVLAAIAISGFFVLVGSVLGTAFGDDGTFPTTISVSFQEPVNQLADWITTNLYPVTNAMKDGATTLLINPLQTVLTTSPWWLVVGFVFFLALIISGLRPAVVAAVCLALVAALQLWEHGMETLATVLVAMILTLAIGVFFGVLSARWDRFGAGLRPILDAAQTMPSFVYLVPAIALFGATRFTAIVAAVIFAAPPVIRLVDSGIRSVPAVVVESATAAGANSRQLLFKVQLPMSRQALLLAANQGIIQVLAMVVVGGLVGAGGLGFDVVSGFSQASNFGLGLAAGLATVLLGIMLDRITQGAGGRPAQKTPTRA